MSGRLLAGQSRRPKAKAWIQVNFQRFVLTFSVLNEAQATVGMDNRE